MHALLERREPDEAARLAAVAASGAVRRQGDPRLAEIVKAAAAHYQTEFAAVSLITHDRQILLSRVGIDADSTDRSEAFCAVAIQRPGEALVVPDAQVDARFAHMAAVQEDPRIRFYAGIPLVNRNGYALGALCVADREPLTMPPDLLQLTLLALRAEALIDGAG